MRAMLDKLTSWVGLALAAVLLVAGGLLTWASAFVADQVDYQLGMQAITMPTEEAIAGLSDTDREALEPFVGSPLDTGAEAKAYADHYILAHMNASSDGRTYQQVSGEFVALSDAEKASADGQALGALRQSLFMGNTLRGLLLFAACLTNDKRDFLESSSRHIIDGLVFAFKAMGVVLPIAGFFFIGSGNHSKNHEC